MDNNELVGIERQTVANVIRTLKELDVRGFDSMNRLVGLVMLFEKLGQAPGIQPQQEE